MWIDTHTHLYSSKFDEDRSEAITRAKEEGIEQIYLPSIDKGHYESMVEMEDKDPTFVKLMIGIHPCSVKEENNDELQFVKECLSNRPFTAIGEIGIDLYWDKSFQKQQEELFCQQCDLALEYNLPIVIHVRDAFPEIFAQLEKYRNTGLTGIFHCFSGGKKELDYILDLGFKVGLGGVLTFKNGGLDKVFSECDVSILNHIVLETDAPYLAPHPNRGRRNETSFLPIIGQKLADVFQLSIEEIADITTKNAKEIFIDYEL